jgi:hypothetical protein
MELTGGVAACRLIAALLDGHGVDAGITEALQTRTFHIAPRVNPDGVEWALADSPRLRRSSIRSWPWPGHRHRPGLRVCDVDGDGRILHMRVPDPDGAWTPSRHDPRILAPVPARGAPAGTVRYRLYAEGDVVDGDGFTVPVPAPPESLDLNRNFPAGWSPQVKGSGDHPLSEPEIDALVRAIVARPTICLYHALHTFGGFLLRPSSTRPDRELPPDDVWTWEQLATPGVQATGYTSHSVYEDFTFDPRQPMSGASDDWAYEHLGIFGWTVELWDVVQRATGTKCTPQIWRLGPSEQQQRAVLAWAERHGHELFVDWYPFEHPQLGAVELGGWNQLVGFENPPPALLAAEVEPLVEFVVGQALSTPRLTVRAWCEPLTATGEGEQPGPGEHLVPGLWRVCAGITNAGYLPTDISARARAERLVLPLRADCVGEGVEVLGGPSVRELGQLDGRAAAQYTRPGDGAGDRVLADWTVRAATGARLTVTVTHPRVGRVEASVVLGGD